MDWRRLARSAKRLGFDGLDLTVRKGGHVRPERAAEDLPRAVGMAREEGVDVPMITTALTSADDPTARAVLSTAASSVSVFQVGYYLPARGRPPELARAGQEFRRPVDLATGDQVGFTTTQYIERRCDAAHLSSLDPAGPAITSTPDMVAEGGAGAWKTAVHR
jgi:hypothetical protein